MAHPLILMATDRPGWCFDHIAQAIQRELAEYYSFKIMPYGKVVKEECDVLIALCWERALLAKANTKCRAMVPCLYDHLSWKINDDSLAHFKLTLKNSAAVAVCNKRMLEDLKRIIPASELPTVFLLEDGVDTGLFRELPPPDKFACGWTGMSTRCTPGGPDDYKGLGLLKAACAKANVELRVLDSAGGGLWPHARMPVFYQDVSVQLIGSVLEGTPNPLLEALAMGRPVITTDVGLAREVIVEGETGFIVARNEEAFGKRIQEMAIKTKADLIRMGQKARAMAMRYSWAEKAKTWKACLDFACLGTETARAHGNVQVFAPIAVERPITMHPLESAVPIATAIEPVRAKPVGKPRALLISDVREWAFHQNMMDLELHLNDQFDFEHWFVRDYLDTAYVPDMNKFDVVFCVYHRWRIDELLPWDRAVGSLRAFWFFPENIAPPGPVEFDIVNRFRAFQLVTRQNFNEVIGHCPNAVYLTNPINMLRFPTETQVDDRLVASWNGNSRHASGSGLDVKGFNSSVRPATQMADVPFEYAEYHSKRLAAADMPAFYQKTNVGICASLYEGASNSVMEAMASGLAIISTRCGNIVEMQESQIKHLGETGIILVERSINEISGALTMLKHDVKRIKTMGRINREEIATRWSWPVWKDRYADFLRKAI